eukprot:364372-Chlamydomonas_euryale.AAC.1
MQAAPCTLAPFPAALMTKRHGLMLMMREHMRRRSLCRSNHQTFQAHLNFNQPNASQRLARPHSGSMHAARATNSSARPFMPRPGHSSIGLATQTQVRPLMPRPGHSNPSAWPLKPGSGHSTFGLATQTQARPLKFRPGGDFPPTPACACSKQARLPHSRALMLRHLVAAARVGVEKPPVRWAEGAHIQLRRPWRQSVGSERGQKVRVSRGYRVEGGE